MGDTNDSNTEDNKGNKIPGDFLHNCDPKRFPRSEYADLDFDTIVILQKARSLCCALMIGPDQGGEDTVPPQHRDNCMMIIADMLSEAEKKVGKLGELAQACQIALKFDPLSPYICIEF